MLTPSSCPFAVLVEAWPAREQGHLLLPHLCPLPSRVTIQGVPLETLHRPRLENQPRPLLRASDWAVPEGRSQTLSRPLVGTRGPGTLLLARPAQPLPWAFGHHGASLGLRRLFPPLGTSCPASRTGLSPTKPPSPQQLPHTGSGPLPLLTFRKPLHHHRKLHPQGVDRDPGTHPEEGHEQVDGHILAAQGDRHPGAWGGRAEACSEGRPAAAGWSPGVALAHSQPQSCPPPGLAGPSPPPARLGAVSACPAAEPRACRLHCKKPPPSPPPMHEKRDTTPTVVVADVF